MRKRMLLLGLLRSQELHGYGLLDYVGEHSMGGGAIGKSNAYRLLRVMENDGWIVSHREKEGNRPERLVYRVTEEGEAAFLRLLEEDLAEDSMGDPGGQAALNYLGELKADVAARQLTVRRDRVQERLSRLNSVPLQVMKLHPALDLTQKQCEVELEWLNNKLAELDAQLETA